ncbi:DUF2235 domain-containing protein [Luteibacter sp.]|jgi:hypothetical protein|uniref:DUF2235 domain-containing protein n=1 Tax=Luteibacter sp. TaxID=1886636 RepID=UPI002F425562
MREQQAKHSVPVLQSRNNPHEYLFIALFDGTGQDANDTSQLLTNVGELRNQSERMREGSGGRIGYHYVEGIGTQKNPITRAIDGAFPYTWDDKIRVMYTDIAGQTSRWKDLDPQAKVRVVGVGYSRGAVLVPGLARLVDQYGIVDPEGMKFGRDANGNLSVTAPRTLIAPGEVAQAVGLFDPVGTNLPRNYDARLPKSVLSGFSQIARDEQRELFPHQTILDPDWSDDGRFLSATVPGGHSNVGGGNKEAGLEVMAFNGMADYLNALTDQQLFEHRPLPDDPAQYAIFQAKGATAAFGLRMDHDGQRDLRNELANCKIVDLCHDADPVDQSLARQFGWQQVTPQVAQIPPRLPEPIAFHRSTPPPAPASQRLLDDPMHPDYRMFRDARRLVHELDRAHRREPDERSDNLSAALVVAARADGLNRIDRVELMDGNDKLSAVEAGYGPAKRTTVPVVESMDTPLERSSVRWTTTVQVSRGHDEPSLEQARDVEMSPTAMRFHQAAPAGMQHESHDPRHPGNPNHELYRELQRQVPQASEDRLLQFTAACHTSRITADNLRSVRLDPERMTLEFQGAGLLTTAARIDLSAPPTYPQEAIAQIQQFDRQQTQIMDNFQAQQAQLGMGRSM